MLVRFASGLALILASANISTALEVVQAQVPPRKTFELPSCEQQIFQHNFASSYGAPYVGIYTPPKDCHFTTTIFNISVTSKGRQYDRLALLFFGDIEIWRTSTAMPTEDGIYWDYQKDMTAFDSLLRAEQKVIFDLSNVYSDLYTGAFNVTLNALYYNDKYVSDLTPPDKIYPISALASDKNISSVMSLPDDNGTVSIKPPKNVRKAMVTLLASGNSAEEFWFTNVPTEYVNTFPENPGWLYGYSPFREIQLLIDGKLAGYSWPFPLLFTGGVDPGLWRPIVGIDTYDLPAFEIDITPWLPVICDGRYHTFGLKVVGFDSFAEGNIGTIGENWWVTGAVFFWLDAKGKQTTGGKLDYNSPPPSFEFHPEVKTITSNSTTTNSSLFFSLEARRTLSLSSVIHLSTGPKTVSWSQSTSFLNIQNMTNSGYNQSLSQLTTGSHSDSVSGVKSTYSYPINLYSFYIIAPSLETLSSVFALVDRSLIKAGVNLLSTWTGINLGSSSLKTRQTAESRYHWNETIVEGTSEDTGKGEQWFSYEGRPGLERNGVSEYSRYLVESNDAIVMDNEKWGVIAVPNTAPLPYVEGEPSV